MKAISDTGFLVAFANRNDSHHEWAVELAQEITEPLLTCEAVLAEAAFHLGSSSLVLKMISTGLIRIGFQAKEHLPRITQLATRYADRSPDFADLCLIRMSELYPRFPIITTDKQDFRIYRRNKREVIPLIVPS